MVLSPDDPVDGIDEDVQLFSGFGLGGPQFLHLRYPVLMIPALQIADLLKRIKAGPGHHDEAADRVVLFVDFLSAFDGLLLLQFKQGFDLSESFFWSHSDPRYSGLLYLFRTASLLHFPVRIRSQSIHHVGKTFRPIVRGFADKECANSTD